jgi:hypothetical protein
VLKLTSTNGAAIFVNPKLVTTVVALLHEGAVVCFGSSETCIDAQEAAEDIAREVADQIGTYSIVDVSAIVAQRSVEAEERTKAVRDCPGSECPGCPGCEVPF